MPNSGFRHELRTWSDHRGCPEARYCRNGVAVIQTDEQMLLAQQRIADLRTVLLKARKVHSSRHYTRLAEPILIEIQQREQDILEYLSSGLEQPLAS